MLAHSAGVTYRVPTFESRTESIHPTTKNTGRYIFITHFLYNLEIPGNGPLREGKVKGWGIWGVAVEHIQVQYNTYSTILYVNITYRIASHSVYAVPAYRILILNINIASRGAGCGMCAYEVASAIYSATVSP